MLSEKFTHPWAVRKHDLLTIKQLLCLARILRMKIFRESLHLKSLTKEVRVMTGRCTLVAVLMVVLGFTVSAHAILIDRGDGMIYDTGFNITWLQDANYAQTRGLGYNSTGGMSWRDAMSWAENLDYGGYTDWRLPSTLDPDPSCSDSINADGIYVGSVNCIGSEFGHLYYIEFGNAPGGPLLYTGPFFNIQPGVYWTSTEFLGPGSYPWQFSFYSGSQIIFDPGCCDYAWAVRDGDVAAVPEPATLLLLGSGLVGLALMRKKFKKWKIL